MIQTIDLAELMGGYRERMRRLALIKPFEELAGKRREDDNGERVDMCGLGLLTLLFFFERRLSREYKTGTIHVATFLQEVTKKTYSLKEETIKEIARELITTFRPDRGRKRSFSYFNWETEEEDVIEYSILKAHGFDGKTQQQYYTLDDDGLDLLFSTKEFFTEFQISINQLLLKQQIKKGEFHDALRQVREMELDVSVLKDKIHDMRAEILRSIISEETYARYESLLNETYERFEREDDEFKELSQFIKETRDTIYAEDVGEDEEQSSRLITKIASELEAVHYEHSRLLELTSELRTTALVTARETLYNTGVQMFNFDQDIVSNILAKPLSPNKMKGVLHPFLRVEQNKLWSPLTLFAEQTIIVERGERHDDGFVESSEHLDKDELYRQLMSKKYGKVMELFIQHYQNDNANTLEQLMKHLQETNKELLGKRYFYSFWLILHQYSPLTINSSNNSEGQAILQDALNQIDGHILTIMELPTVVQIHPKYSIQNMKITLEEY